MRFFALILMLAAASRVLQTPPPGGRVDPATGHRVIQVSDEPGSATLYFHDQASPDRGAARLCGGVEKGQREKAEGKR
jgi:oligogalacturonide lyase